MNDITHNIALSGHFGENNVGDDILLLSLVENLLITQKVKELVIFTADVRKTAALFEREKVCSESIRLIYSGRWGIREQGKPLFKSLCWLIATVTGLKKAGLHLIGPGTIIKDSNNRFFILFWLMRALLSYMLRRPFAFIGIGVGCVRFSLSKFLLRSIANHAKFITTRDSRSLAQLKSLHVDKPKMASYPDLSFAGISTSANMSTGASQITKVGLNFREFKAKHFSDNTIRIYRDSILTLLHRIPESVELVFYSFCNEPHQSDLEMYNKIITDVGPQNVKIRNFEYENLSALKDDISTCNVFVGTRFHSVLLAVQAGVPTIGLSYEQKTVNFMNDAGIGDYALDIGTIKNEDISRTWDKLIMNNSQYEVQLKGIAKDHRILSLKHFEEISLVLCPRR